MDFTELKTFIDKSMWMARPNHFLLTERAWQPANR
jgi:hypothetical protein